MIQKIKRIINNIKLCIKYPFLYPRNQNTNTHYINYKLKNKYEFLIRDSMTWGYDSICFKIITNYPKFILGLFLKWFHNYPLQLFHCIPTYTLLDKMPEGWRKAFGEEICKEIKEVLLKRGNTYLYKYRIIDIKEKWGYLHWYDKWSNLDIENIIEKYENISYNTCIKCGKPAKYLSKGWISPYCENCSKNLNKEYIK